MPDWNAIVRDRLFPLDLSAKEREEVVAELAAHFEDLHEEQMRKGLSEPEASEKVMGELARWRGLAKDIRRAKLKEGIMNARTKRLWLPGLVSLATSMVFLMVPIQISMQPRYLGRSPLQMVLLPWLALLPLCGAGGTSLSRRGGGYRWTRLAAGLFPTIVLFVLGSILVITHLMVPAQPRLWYGSLVVTLGIVLPTTSLLVGRTEVPALKGAQDPIGSFLDLEWGATFQAAVVIAIALFERVDVVETTSPTPPSRPRP